MFAKYFYFKLGSHESANTPSIQPPPPFAFPEFLRHRLTEISVKLHTHSTVDVLVIICRDSLSSIRPSILPDSVSAIQIYEVGVPAAVRAGENVLLACHYDMQGDVLYSIKWYKGRREFYRYTLKENPAKKVFKVAGMTVDVSPSDGCGICLPCSP